MDMQLKAFIDYPGEPGAGLFGCRIEIELPIDTPSVRQETAPGEFLNSLRDKIRSVYEAVDDEPFSITFNMECPDCLNIWGEHHKDCPSNPPLPAHREE